MRKGSIVINLEWLKSFTKPRTHRELAAMFKIDSSTASRQTTKLEKMGLVELTGRDHKLLFVFQITDFGKTIVEHVWGRVNG